jgi:serine/threonine protein phosphatase PrpC
MVKTKRRNIKNRRKSKKRGGSRPVLLGYHQLPAYKTPTEDRISEPLLTDQNLICAVFDGHGGSEIVEKIYNELPKRIKQAIGPFKEPQKIAEIMVAEFEKLDLELEHTKSGSTATVAVILEKHIVIANVGDSPAILFNKKGEILGETMNHDCNNISEANRVKKAGGYCIPDLAGIKRLRSGLAVTRSFGDFIHNKNIVIATPQTYIWSREPDAILALMSDSFTEEIVTDYLGRESIRPILKSTDIVKELLTSLDHANFNVEIAAKKAVEDRVKYLDMQGDNTSLLFAYL